MRIIAATVIRVLHPVGPLPASVYWRRRAVAFAGLVAVLLLIWAVLPGGGDDTPRDSAAAVGSPSPTEPAAAPGSTGPGGLTASPASDDPGRAGDGRAATTTSVATTPKPTPKQAPPPAPTPCPDSALRLTVSPAQPVYVVGQAPVLRLQVRNVGTLPCTRDLGAALQEVLLYRGTQRLWSSNDCYPEGERDQELMRPGVLYTFPVTWSGLASQPKCAGSRTRVGAGSYTLVGRLGSLVSPGAPLTLRAV
jgi:hypothetical protein